MNDHDLDLDLEGRLRTMYAGFTPEDPGRAVSGVASAVASARARARSGVWRVRWLRPAVALGLAAAAVLAVVVAPLLLPSTVAPISSPSASPASPRPTTTLSPGPSGSSSPQPSSEFDRMTAAAIDDAGPIRGGGMWAVSGTRLMLSFDGGATWTATAIPATDEAVSFVPSTAVLDARHAWAVRAGAGSHTGGPNDFVSLVVYRTADGGGSWQSTTIPGNFAGGQSKLLFANAQDGFLVSVGFGTDGLTTVSRTSDGGANWTGSPKKSLDWDVSISDATTLWVSAMGGGAMCGHCGEPLLQVSRDAGATWAVARLPGYEGKLTTGSLSVAAAPAFLDASTGYVIVNESKTSEPSDGSSRIFRTADGGRTWSVAGTAPYWLDNVSIVDATHWFGDAAAAPPNDAAASTPKAVATDDAGKTWHEVATDLSGFMKGGTWFVDPVHGGAIEGPGLPDLPSRVLYVTADGGRTWHPASFGAAASSPGPSTPEADAQTAEAFAATFVNAANADQWPLAWGMLSPHSQSGFGSLESFEASQKPYDLAAQGSGGMTIDGSTPFAEADRATLGLVYADVLATADASRARVVMVLYGAVAAPVHRQALIAAPLAGTDQWRLWIVSQV